MHREAKEWERVGVGTYKIDIEKENHGLKGKKLDKSWGGGATPPPKSLWGGGERPFATPLSSPLRQKLPQIYTANHLPNTDTKNLSTDLGLFLPYVQEVVNPIYIVTHHINWSNYFLDAQ